MVKKMISGTHYKDIDIFSDAVRKFKLFNWFRNMSTTDIVTLQDRIIDFYKNLIEYLDTTFRDRWDFQVLVQDYVHTKVRFEFKTVGVMLYYPEFEIKNLTKMTYPIKDFYVILNFGIAELPANNYYFSLVLKDLLGFKTTFSKEEIYYYTKVNRYYIHSHIKTYNLLLGNAFRLEFLEFCIGSGQLSSYMYSRDFLKFDRQKFIIFFAVLSSYLRFESAAGKPHIFFSKVPKAKERVIQNVDENVNYLVDTAKLKKIFLRFFSEYKFKENFGLVLNKKVALNTYMDIFKKNLTQIVLKLYKETQDKDYLTVLKVQNSDINFATLKEILPITIEDLKKDFYEMCTSKSIVYTLTDTDSKIPILFNYRLIHFDYYSDNFQVQVHNINDMLDYYKEDKLVVNKKMVKNFQENIEKIFEEIIIKKIKKLFKDA